MAKHMNDAKRLKLAWLADRVYIARDLRTYRSSFSRTHNLYLACNPYTLQDTTSYVAMSYASDIYMLKDQGQECEMANKNGKDRSVSQTLFATSTYKLHCDPFLNVFSTPTQET